MSKEGRNKWALMFWKPADSVKSSPLKEMQKEHKGNKSAVKKFYSLVEVIEEVGPSLPLPYNKDLKNGLCELRDVKNGKRYYYKETSFYFEDEEETVRIVLLISACGNKGNQQGDIERALGRVKGGIGSANILNDEGLTIKNKEDLK